ncbi:hypothetical protein F5Y06DRAFT_181623 [Hypoxylon sp. FL0890]|nr:hypothetical protein F5Y06DRAFT_181623 [Hypoxylon sp. FL0890]
MSTRSSRDCQQGDSRPRQEHRGVHTTERPAQGHGTTYVYTRIQGGGEGGAGAAGPSNQAPPVSFLWQESSSSGYSNRGQEYQLGPAPRRRDLDENISQWMQAMSISTPTTHAGQAAPTSAAAVRPSSSPYRSVDPNTTAPSVAGSHLSGQSYPSRPASPERPVWDRPSAANQQHVMVRRPGYVPPERRAERERADREVVVENSERRRRRERREEERRRNR